MNSIITIKFKNAILPFMFCVFLVCLIVFSKTNLVAVSNGLFLWANNVVPSLLPFFIGTELLLQTNIVPWLGKVLNPIMRPVFNVPR